MSDSIPPDEKQLRDNYVLRFRTITTMIQCLQWSRLDMNNPAEKLRIIDNTIHKGKRHTLRVLCALATLLVRSHEVFAVVTNQPVLSETGEVSVDVLACVSKAQDKATKNHFFSVVNPPEPNPRDKEIPAECLGRAFISEPQKITLDPSKPLTYVLESLSSQTFADHAYVVAELLRHHHHSGPPSSESHWKAAAGFMDYIAARCSVRMYRRINNVEHSQPFFTALKAVKKLDYHHITPTQPKRPSRFDGEFLKGLPEIVKRCKLTIPHLMDISRKHIASDGSLPFTIYTPQTCHEFHKVLSIVLDAFKDALAIIAKPIKKNKPISKQDLLAQVFLIRSYGNFLLSIAWGEIIETHLLTIASVLEKNFPGQGQTEAAMEPAMPVTEKAKKAAKKAKKEAEKAEEEAERVRMAANAEDIELAFELGEVQPGVTIGDNKPLSVVQSFREWLRLMVSHFDACRTALSSTNPDISIKVIVAPYQGIKMAPWKDVVSSICDEEMVPAVINLLETLAQERPDFRSFGPTGTLSSGTFSHGTLHCEAIVVSLMYLCYKGTLGVIDDELRHQFNNLESFVGVSRRCCPVCATLLNLLEKEIAINIQVKGAHQCVYACTLPPWLPSKILGNMVDIFGEQLNATLKNMLDASGVGWGKLRLSEDSATMSLASDDGGRDYSILTSIIR